MSNHPRKEDHWIAEKIDRTGPRHLVRRGFGLNSVAYCTGRTISMMVPVEGAPVTCKACLRRLAKDGH